MKNNKFTDIILTIGIIVMFLIMVIGIVLNLVNS